MNASQHRSTLRKTTADSDVRERSPGSDSSPDSSTPNFKNKEGWNEAWDAGIADGDDAGMQKQGQGGNAPVGTNPNRNPNPLTPTGEIIGEELTGKDLPDDVMYRDKGTDLGDTGPGTGSRAGTRDTSSE